jgi:hypothetical protein
VSITKTRSLIVTLIGGFATATEYNVPMKLDKISEILSEPDIIKDRKLSGKKVRENGEKKTIYS